jgi:glycosyltransferase involved in cell wall biosynthesis
MRPLVAIPFSRPACAASVALTLARQTVHADAVVVENGPALGAYPGATIVSGPSAGAARNAAIDYARAGGYDWIVFLDDDDYYGPEYVRQCVALAASGSADAYHQGMAFVRFEDDRLFAFGGTALGYACVIANSLVLRVDGAPYFPEMSGGEEKAWTKSYRGRITVAPPWHHIYNRTGSNSWAATRVQMLYTYGPAYVIDRVPDEFVDAPRSLEAYPRAMPPGDERVFTDLERLSRRRLLCSA